VSLHGPSERLEAGPLREVEKLIERLAPAIRHAPLGGADWERLATGGRGGFVAAWADDGGPGDAADGGTDADPDGVIAYAQATQLPADEQWVAEVVIDPDHQSSLVDLGAPLLSRVLRHSVAHAHWWVSDPSPAHLELAARLGLHPHRVLHQMRRPLPVGEPWDIPVRPFVPGQDEDAVLTVNRRAFAAHPDQGQMSRAQLDARVAEPWFDPNGFLLSEIDGRLAGFCWTKVFTDLVPQLGEIHIIGVDPDFAGRKLGPQLVLAGLDHLASKGIGEGVLFVEGDNSGALAMYEKLGFRVTRTDHAFATSAHG
jgi:mycothiol synthase